jgi:hypothetical protein
LRTSPDDRDLVVPFAGDCSRRPPLVSTGPLGCGVSGVVCTLIQAYSGSDARIACIPAESGALPRAQRAALAGQRPESLQESLPGELPRPICFALSCRIDGLGGGVHRNGHGERGQRERDQRRSRRVTSR